MTTTTWVHLLPHPFDGVVYHTWLTARLADSIDDLLELAHQYTTGAGTGTTPRGPQIADDGSYGPLLPDGSREEGSDFNDHLGVPWSYGSWVDAPEPEQFGAVDCSGYVRKVLSHRSGLPVTLQPEGVALPRRAVHMAESASGVVVIADAGRRPMSTSALLSGDLLFFDASTDDGTLVDHVAIYLGAD